MIRYGMKLKQVCGMVQWKEDVTRKLGNNDASRKDVTMRD